MNDPKTELRSLMAWYGLKAKDVAKLIHREPTTVRNYMSGSNEISQDLVDLLREKIDEKRKKEEEYIREKYGPGCVEIKG